MKMTYGEAMRIQTRDSDRIFETLFHKGFSEIIKT